jgi:hypothetical protein
MQTLVRLIYTSRCTAAADPAALNKICAVAQPNNRRDSITGVLLECQGRFLQALEGERSKVTARYAGILADPRHTDCVLLFLAPIDRRNWPEWDMRHVPLTPVNGERLGKLLANFGHLPDPAAATAAIAILEQLTVRGRRPEVIDQ